VIACGHGQFEVGTIELIKVIAMTLVVPSEVVIVTARGEEEPSSPQKIPARPVTWTVLPFPDGTAAKATAAVPTWSA